jgi:hypothetical protein
MKAEVEITQSMIDAAAKAEIVRLRGVISALRNENFTLKANVAEQLEQIKAYKVAREYVVILAELFDVIQDRR